jgi:hypothetical protein
MSLRRSVPIVALAALIAVGLAIRWTTPDLAQDLRPRPDALEYEEGARNLVRGLGYHLVVDGERYVPRYPFGFSLLLAPVLTLWDAGPGTGIVVVLLTAAGTIAGTWALGGVAAGLPGAVVAATIVVFSPLHVRWSEAVMSDVPSSCGTAWLACATLMALRARRGAGTWAAIGVGLGALATVRLSNGLFAVPIAGVLAAASDRTEGDRVRLLAALAVGVLAGLTPLLVFDAVHFGSPLRTGYDVWVPAAKFGWRHLFTDPPVGGGTTPNVGFYVRTLCGAGDLFGFATAALIALGTGCAAFGARDARRLLALALGSLALLLAFYGPFFWQDARFLLPVLPLLAALGAAPFAVGAAATRRVIGAALVVLAAGELAFTAHPYPRDKVFREATVLREISRRIESDAVILVRTNDHYAVLLLDQPGRLWVPLGLDDHRLAVRWLRLTPAVPDPERRRRIDQTFAHPYDAAAAGHALDALVASGRPVYVSTLLAFQVPFMADVLRLAAARFAVERVATIAGTELLRLRPR